MKLGYKAGKIYGVLMSDITSGILRPGERLPTEQELCMRFDASRNTVRNVLKKLYATGRVIHQKNVGAFVVECGIFSNVVSLMCHGNIDLIIRVQNMLLEYNYIMNLFSQKTVGWSPQNEANFLGKLLSTPPKALLASCTPLPPSNNNLLEQLVSAGTRVIHFEPYSADQTIGQEYLLPDYRQAGYAAVTALMLEGCKSIVFAASPVQGVVPPYRKLIEDGCRDCLREQNFDRSLFISESIENILKNEKVLGMLNGKANHPVGIVCVPFSDAKLLTDELNKHGFDVSENTRMITVKLLGDTAISGLSYIDFDRDIQFHRIITSLKNHQSPLHDFIKPKVVRI